MTRLRGAKERFYFYFLNVFIYLFIYLLYFANHNQLGMSFITLNQYNTQLHIKNMKYK